MEQIEEPNPIGITLDFLNIICYGLGRHSAINGQGIELIEGLERGLKFLSHNGYLAPRDFLLVCLWI